MLVLLLSVGLRVVKLGLHEQRTNSRGTRDEYEEL